MKILQVNASYKPAFIYGGPTMSVSKLSEELVKAGCEVEVFTTTANGKTELPVKPGVSAVVDGVKVTYFKRLTKDHSHFSPALLKELRHRVKEFDVVHIHAWWNLVSVLSCRVAIIHRVPVVVSPRGTLSPYSFGNRNSLSKKLIHGLLGKRLLQKSDIHVTSKREKEAMEALFTPQTIFNIPNFVSLPHEVPEIKGKKNEYLRLIFFSRIEEKKGLDILLDALALTDIPWRLTVAGDGEVSYVNQLKALAGRHGIADKIDWIGFRSDDKFEVLAGHDLMVLPSYDENFGNVVIESLGAGTPVLISKNVGLADYVEDNKLGWVCGQDAASFASAIRMIFDQPEELAGIRQQAIARIRHDFDEQNLAKRYMEMYNLIIDHGRIQRL